MTIAASLTFGSRKFIGSDGTLGSVDAIAELEGINGPSFQKL
jgi:hypothetical protein